MWLLKIKSEKMKNVILILIVCVFSTNIYSQQQLPSKQEIKTFLKSNTYVVLNNNIFSTWNNEIRDAVDKHWKITKYEYVNPNQHKVKKERPGASFIQETKAYFDGQQAMGVYKYLSLYLGQKGGNINTMPDIVDVPLAHADNEPEDYYYKLGIALLFMQKHINWLKANPNIKDRSVMNYYMKAKEHTKNKTLYILKKELSADVNTLSKIKQFYKGKVKLATEQEIMKVVDNKDNDAVILHLVAPDKDIDDILCMKMIIGASDAKLYYFNYHKIKRGSKPGAFLKSDFVKINKQ